MRQGHKRTRRLFTVDEDCELRRLVAIHGDGEWEMIAEALPGRSCRQCRERWINYLSPAINNGPWSDSELRLLEQKVAELGQRWKPLEVFFPGRTDINIRNHYRQMRKAGRPPAVPPQPEPPAPPPPKPKPLPGFDEVMAALVREHEDGFSHDNPSTVPPYFLF
jgi:hypothetical protein